MRPDGKPEGLRQSMSWLHTWSSLVLGWLLYAIFLTGTLSYFRAEIDEWMRPELHHTLPSALPTPQILDTALRHLHTQAPDAPSWTVNLPGPRQNTLSVSWRKPPEPSPNGTPQNTGGRANTITHHLDAQTGQAITPRETRGGGFLYRFHFELYGMPRGWARWIVGIATAAMFVAILSGVITHKKIFTDFFTFRPRKGQRSWLDAHNASAVLSLPFHLMITFSGLLLLMNTLLPAPVQYLYDGNTGQYLAELRGTANARTNPAPGATPSPTGEERGRANRPPRTGTGTDNHTTSTIPTLNAATLLPMLQAAQSQWSAHGVGRITIDAPNTSRTTIELREAAGSHLSQRGNARTLRYHAATGAVIPTPEITPPSGTRATYNILTAPHLGRFAEPSVRWLLVLAGLSGVLMVGTGMVLWVVKRLPQRAKQSSTPRGHRLVEIFNVATIAGLPVAIAGYFWLNRLLPATLSARADAEIQGFFLIWLACLLHACLRAHRPAWKEQTTASAILFGLLPVLNPLTGGAGLADTLWHGQWSIASLDLLALLLAACCTGALWWLRRTPAPAP